MFSTVKLPNNKCGYTVACFRDGKCVSLKYCRTIETAQQHADRFVNNYTHDATEWFAEIRDRVADTCTVVE